MVLQYVDTQAHGPIYTPLHSPIVALALVSTDTQPLVPIDTLAHASTDTSTHVIHLSIL